MPLPDPIPQYLLDFYTYEDVEDPTKFELPDNNDITPARHQIPRINTVPNSSLIYTPLDFSYKTEDPNKKYTFLNLICDIYDPELNLVGPDPYDEETESNLLKYYNRVAHHPILDMSYRLLDQPRWVWKQLGPDNSAHLRTIYIHLHNGLIRFRRNVPWKAEELYHWALRFLTYTQDKYLFQGLGPVEFSKWYIAHDCYHFKVQDWADPDKVKVPPPKYTLAQREICDRYDKTISTLYGPYRDLDYKRFKRARVSVHFVDLTGGRVWGFILRHAATSTAYFFGGIANYPEQAIHAIRKAFVKWLRASELPSIRKWKVINDLPAIDPEDSLSSLHVLAHLVSFIRFGQFGWHHIPAFKVTSQEALKFGADECAKMTVYMGESLHRLLGLTLYSETPTGPVIPLPQPDPTPETDATKLERIAKKLTQLTEKEEFQTERDMWEYKRRLGSWAQRGLAAKKRKQEESQHLQEYIDFFNQMDHVNNWCEDRENWLLDQERMEFKLARRNRREILRLQRELGLPVGVWKRQKTEDEKQQALKSGGDPDAEVVEPMVEYWGFDDWHLESTDEEDDPSYGRFVPVLEHEKAVRHHLATPNPKYDEKTQRMVALTEMLLNKKKELFKYTGDLPQYGPVTVPPPDPKPDPAKNNDDKQEPPTTSPGLVIKTDDTVKMPPPPTPPKKTEIKVQVTPPGTNNKNQHSNTKTDSSPSDEGYDTPTSSTHTSSPTTSSTNTTPEQKKKNNNSSSSEKGKGKEKDTGTGTGTGTGGTGNGPGFGYGFGLLSPSTTSTTIGGNTTTTPAPVSGTSSIFDTVTGDKTFKGPFFFSIPDTTGTGTAGTGGTGGTGGTVGTGGGTGGIGGGTGGTAEEGVSSTFITQSQPQPEPEPEPPKDSETSPGLPKFKKIFGSGGSGSSASSGDIYEGWNMELEDI